MLFCGTRITPKTTSCKMISVKLDCYHEKFNLFHWYSYLIIENLYYVQINLYLILQSFNIQMNILFIVNKLYLIFTNPIWSLWIRFFLSWNWIWENWKWIISTIISILLGNEVWYISNHKSLICIQSIWNGYFIT